jgi:hypothetical protein
VAICITRVPATVRSDDEQNHHDDDGDDDGGDGDRAGAHGVSEPVGAIYWRPYSVSPMVSPNPPGGLNGPPRMPSGHDFGDRIHSVSAAAGPFAVQTSASVVKAETLAADDR